MPAQVVSVDVEAETAVVSVGTVRQEVNTALVEGVQPGEFLLIHVGFALGKLSQEEAERTLALLAEEPGTA
ncbi:MAG: HypC/HybG/HupF family hydrogenase formation chaperone [Planctomycetota bacterium]